VTNWVIGNFDNLAIGRAFPAAGLGLYSRVYTLLWGPVTALIATLQRVLFPAFSLARTRRAYLASISLASLLTIPAYGCAALVAPAVVDGLLGREWEEATSLLAPLAIAMPLHALMALGGPMLWATDRVREEANAQLITAGVCLAAFAGAAMWSIHAVAWAVAAAYAIRFVLVTQAVLRVTGLGWGEIFGAARGGLIVLVMAGPVVLAVDRGAEGASSAVRLGVDAAAGMIVGAIALLAAPKVVVGELLAGYSTRLWRRVPEAVRGKIHGIAMTGGGR
jgi:O-antigen/teichoic acid export membrane protein